MTEEEGSVARVALSKDRDGMVREEEMSMFFFFFFFTSNEAAAVYFSFLYTYINKFYVL